MQIMNYLKKTTIFILITIMLSVTAFATEKPVYPSISGDGGGFVFLLLKAAKDSRDVFFEIDSKLNIPLQDISFLFNLQDKYKYLSINYLLDGNISLNKNTTFVISKKYIFNVIIYFNKYEYGSKKYTVEYTNDSYVICVEELKYIKISAAGDCTLGYDQSYGYAYSFMDEFYKQNQNYSYFFNGVKDIFKKDSLTIINLETPLTTASQKAEKTFSFKGLPEFTNILTEGNIEAVNIANNHTYDYLQAGYNDTVKYLSEAEIIYFGNAVTSIIEIDGIKIGLMGNSTWYDGAEIRKKIKSDIEKLSEDGADIIIASFHWGIEREYYPNQTQKNLSKYAIDCGADLVIGHHPHVLQGVEEYNGKFIVYSLGNFCFGGNKNPSDKDTMIFQQTFTFADNVLHDYNDVKIIPCMISSVKNRNDFMPVVAQGEDRDRIVSRIKEYSKGMIRDEVIEIVF